jgi:UDP-2,3-diacylglucosamine pyrophosphatase LpxH
MDQKKIVVISDTHLGYEKCDRVALNDFLDALEKDHEVTDLVLLGDIVDMWRRDASGVFLESRETMDKILGLTKRIEVHYVAGNHDYHVLSLKNDKPFFRYPIEFQKVLSLPDGQYTYRFMHGYEFEYKDDLAIMYPVMDTLCRVMSDDEGSIESDVWGLFTKTWTDIKFILTTIFHRQEKRHVTETAKRLRESPKSRLADSIQDIDRQAYEEQKKKPDEILVYGHTHRPFINDQENLVNSGSWVTDADVHNTYVELKSGKARLFVFDKGEITQREEIPNKHG